MADDQVPVPWNGIEIGSTNPASSSHSINGVFTMTGGGGDLSGGSDQFHFVYQSLTGDCALIARVSWGPNPDGQEVAGVMVRQALASSSDFVAVTVTPGRGATSIYRTPYTPLAAHVDAVAEIPAWVKLVKRGSVVLSYAASDHGGVPGAWKQIGSSQPVASGMVYAGLCQASHAQGGTATFDHVALTTSQQPLFDTGNYSLTPSGAPDMALAAVGGGVKLAALGGAPSQKWLLVSRGGGFYSFQPLSDASLALTVPNVNSESGSPVSVVRDQGLNTQRWTIVTNAGGAYSLLPQFNPGLSLDDFGGNTTSNAVIDVWAYHSTDTHLQWMINSLP